MNHRTPNASSRFYYPLDQMLTVPTVRVLRALSRFDTATAEDVAIAVSETGRRRAIAAILRQLFGDGFVAAHDGSYRITERGRTYLRRMIGRAELAI